MHGIQAQGKWGARPGALAALSTHFPMMISCPVGALPPVMSVFPTTSLCCMGSLTATKLILHRAIRIHDVNIRMNAIELK